MKMAFLLLLLPGLVGLLVAPAVAQNNTNGYATPATGFGLTFELGPGNCTSNAGVIVTYPGSRITVSANATTFGYLDFNCNIAQNTGSVPAGDIPIFKAVANGTDITALSDIRTFYAFTGNGSSGLPSAGNGDHVTTTFLSGGGTSGDCLQWLSGGAIGDFGAPCGVAAGGVVKNPAAGVSQIVVQQNQTTFGANNFENIRYVDPSFNFLQTDVAGSIGNLAAAGAGKTLTLTPCPLGIDVSNTATRPYSVYIATVGTAEAALVTGGTCAAGAASGTVVVTTVNTHGAGFTVGSAYAGIQEALNDAANAYPGNLTQNQRTIVPPTGWQTGGLAARAYNIYAPIYFQQYNSTLDLTGALLNCHTTSRCLAVGDLTNANHFSGLTVEGGWFTTQNVLNGFAITNTVCAANVASITAPGNTFAVGDVVDIQMSSRVNMWGAHTVTGTGATFTFSGCSAAGSIADVGFVNYQNAAIEDSTNHAVLDNQLFIVAQGINGTFANHIVLDNDQAAVISHLNVQGATLTCGTTYCGSAIYAPGPFSTNATVLYVTDSQLSLSCAGNGITNYAGNTLNVTNVVNQGFQQWSINNGINRGGFGGAALTNVYNEVGACSNPFYPGAGVAQRAEAGVLSQGADVTIRGGEAPIGNLPQFAATGGTQYNYCVVVKDSVVGASACLPIGFAQTSGVGAITVAWPRVTGTNTITYDLLRYPGSGASIVTPYTAGCGGGSTTTCGSVATGVAQCSTVVCSTTDTASASTSSYTVGQPAYFPQLNFWPGGWIGAPSSDTNNPANGSGMLYADDITFVTNLSPLISVAGNMHPTVFIHRCDGVSAGVWVTCPGGNSNGNSSPQVGSLVLQNGADTGGPVSNVKGRINFMVNKSASLQTMHLITLADSAPDKTIATTTNRPTNDASDAYIGFDTGSVSINAAGISFGSPVSISNYIANVGDGSSWKERLTASLKSFTVPITTNSQVTSTLATGTAPFVVASTTQVANLNVSAIDGVTLTGTPSAGQVPTATSSSAATWQTPGANAYDTTWSHTSNASNVGTSITLAQADLAANAEWVLEANVAVADAGGTSPTLATQFTLGGTNVSGCFITSTGSGNNGATVKHHYQIRVKVLTTGVSGTSKVQCRGDQVGGAGTNTLNGAGNTTDATTTINTTGSVALTWTCSDSSGTATCHYYDSYTLKLH